MKITEYNRLISVIQASLPALIEIIVCRNNQFQSYAYGTRVFPWQLYFGCYGCLGFSATEIAFRLVNENNILVAMVTLNDVDVTDRNEMPFKLLLFTHTRKCYIVLNVQKKHVWMITTKKKCKIHIDITNYFMTFNN